MIGYAFTGSYCTFSASLKVLRELVESGESVIPIMSENAYSTDTRFFMAEDFKKEVENICNNKIIHSVTEAEPLGPKSMISELIISPCTGNTLAKIANGITDTAVTMAAKSHLRKDRKILIALASNDALSQNLKNIAALICRKSVYFLPMRQDDPIGKPHSLVADFSLLPKAFAEMRENRQMRPIFS